MYAHLLDKGLLLSGLSTCEATTKAALALCASLVTEAVETAAVGFACVCTSEVRCTPSIELSVYADAVT